MNHRIAVVTAAALAALFLTACPAEHCEVTEEPDTRKLMRGMGFNVGPFQPFCYKQSDDPGLDEQAAQHPALAMCSAVQGDDACSLCLKADCCGDVVASLAACRRADNDVACEPTAALMTCAKYHCNGACPGLD